MITLAAILQIENREQGGSKETILEAVVAVQMMAWIKAVLMVLVEVKSYQIGMCFEGRAN